MRVSMERKVAFSLLAAVLITNAIGLAPELNLSRQDQNDYVFHYPLVVGMVRAIEQGRYPFDWWAPEWSFGYPVFRTYQPLGHTMVAGAYFALFKSVSLATVFVWVRYLSVVLLPLTFFFTARLLSLPLLTATFAAILAPLVSTPGLFGIEYGSYIWASWGLFTQAVACHFTLLTMGLSYRTLRSGRLLALTGVMLGLTCLAHFIYGYITGLTLCLIALSPDPQAPRGKRIGRLALVGAIAFVVSAFEVLPLFQDGPFINHSRWEPVTKWDSYGALQVMASLLTGDLLDHGRLPVLTILALVGMVLYFRDVKSLHKPRNSVDTFLVLGAILWVLMLFGRPFWGPLLTLAGVLPDVQLHRVIGGAQIFLVLIAALQLSFIWRQLLEKTNKTTAILFTMVVLSPMVLERGRLLAGNSSSGYLSLTAYEANRSSLDHAIAVARERGGRTYAGPPDGWGGKFTVGAPPVYAYVSNASVPAVSFLYHSMSLSSDLMPRFNDTLPAQYRLFDIRTVLAPSNGLTALPLFLKQLESTPPITIYAAPGTGHFDVVDVPYAVETSRRSFYAINDRWLASDWVEQHQHLFLDFNGDLPAGMKRISPVSELPSSGATPPPGNVLKERRIGEEYQAEIQAERSSYVLFKETWHANWRALVDGHPVRTAMLSPGFVGIPITAGHHEVSLSYRPEWWQALLAAAGIGIGLLLIAAESLRTISGSGRIRT